MNQNDKINNEATVSEFCKDMENMRGVKLTENAARGIEVTSLASIAISLKRIADSLQYKPTAGGEIKMPDMFIDFSKKVGI